MRSEPMREFRDDVCGGRRDSEEGPRDPPVQCDRPPILLLVVKSSSVRGFSKAFAAWCRNELSRIVRHHHEKVVDLLYEQTRQLRDL